MKSNITRRPGPEEQSSGIDLDVHEIKSSASIIDVDIHALSTVEEKWHTFEKECFAIYRAVLKWRDIIIQSPPEVPIIVATDSNTALGQWKANTWTCSTAKARTQQNQIEIVYTPIFAAHRNGLLERQHRVLSEVLRFYLLSKNKNWETQIPKIQARINDRTIGITDDNRRITPFRLVNGLSRFGPFS